MIASLNLYNLIFIVIIITNFGERKMSKNQKNKPLGVPIQIYVPEKKKEEIESVANDLETSISEFIRQAINKEIRRIKYPEKFQPTNQQINPLILEQISKNTKKNLELSELMAQRQNKFDGLMESFDLIQLYITPEELDALKDDIKEIRNMLTAHKALNIKEIVEKTGIMNKKITKIVSNRSMFKYDISTERFSLKEDNKNGNDN